jgi:hypothetical protein
MERSPLEITSIPLVPRSLSQVHRSEKPAADRTLVEHAVLLELLTDLGAGTLLKR